MVNPELEQLKNEVARRMLDSIKVFMPCDCRWEGDQLVICDRCMSVFKPTQEGSHA